MNLTSQIIEGLSEKEILSLFEVAFPLWETPQGKQLKELLSLFNTHEESEMIVTEMKEKIPKIILEQLTEPYDMRDMVLEIRPGQGGLDAQDWAKILFELYTSFLKKQRIPYEIIDYTDDEIGITSATLKVSGLYSFGSLKSEAGLHRLERKSPFNAKGKLQTSHAILRVLPYIANSDKITIQPTDIEIKTTKSSGPGGQNVNKIESAVVIRHIPTGIVVRSSQTRSQMQNRQIAMEILQSELLLRKKIESEQQRNSFKNTTEQTIRTYDFGLRQVKDHRSGTKFNNIDFILKGNIEKLLIFSVLSSK